MGRWFKLRGGETTRRASTSRLWKIQTEGQPSFNRAHACPDRLGYRATPRLGNDGFTRPVRKNNVLRRDRSTTATLATCSSFVVLVIIGFQRRVTTPWWTHGAAVGVVALHSSGVVGKTGSDVVTGSIVRSD